MLFEESKSYDTIHSQMSNLNKIQKSYLDILKEFGVTSDEVLENTPARAAKAMEELLNCHDELAKIN
jgi:GTP cyclohydrolase I